MQKLLFVMNPYAGQRRANRVLPEILTIFNEAGYEVTVFMTTGPGNCLDIVRNRAKDFDLVVCAGGDGTMNETISGMLESGAERPIGYIPCGSTNDFAASVKLSTDLLQAARDIVAGEEQSYDVGRFNGRYFSYVASFGIFARLSYSTPQSMKNLLGHLAYVLSGVQVLSQIRRIPTVLELDGEVLEGEYILGAVTNTTVVGGVPVLDPRQVDLRDGKFEVTLVRMPKDMAELAACVAAIQNQTDDCDAVTFRTVSSLVVRQKEPVDWTLDGERAEGSPVIHIENLNRAIRLRRRREEP